MTAAEATHAVFEAWERGDADGVAALFAPDGRYEDPLFPEPLIGPAAIRDGVAPAIADIRDLRIPVKLIAEHGDTAICEASFLSELASGDGRLDFEFAMVVEMRDGKIARLTEYFDASPFQQ
ncbi:MAG TPA: nuclear transport factor 2 family protein [Gaiellales bacterium]|jgi:ketosteroid isomerase-like protein|nr:nuclear transport factor 2 family protein [Gaiellales bacterium]